MEKNPEKKISATTNILLASGAGIGATVLINPFDVVKTRLQIQAGLNQQLYNGNIDCFKKILMSEGLKGFSSGIGAALMRQVLYTGGRFGFFQYLENSHIEKYGKKSPPLLLLLNGSLAGAFGSTLAMPSEVVLVRMMVDDSFPPEKRRNYKNCLNALIRITREEGASTLFRGFLPTVYKGILLNMIQLGPYYQLKDYMITKHKFKNDRFLQTYCSFIMGFFSSVATAPLDFAKSKLQEMKPGPDGKIPYRGTFDVLIQVTRSEGFFKNFSGLFMYFLRIGNCNVLIFIFLEELTRLYRIYS